MKPGLYEKLITAQLREQLLQLDNDLSPEIGTVDKAESPLVLTQHFSEVLLNILEGVDQKSRASLINELLLQLYRLAQEDPDTVSPELEQLLRIEKVVPFKKPVPRPSIPLNSTDLLINARGEHRIGTEIMNELASADRVDLLCSFLKWSGFRLLRQSLQEFIERGGKLRVITTCYLGATDSKALNALAELGDVRVSYDSRRTRLHAKAWLFHRETTYSTAFIGSSNMSSAALVDGLEWNVRLARYDNPRVLQKFEATFESYWQDAEFEPYDSNRDSERFLSAVREQRSGRYENQISYHLEVRPYPFQTEILEKLDTERLVHNRWKNLVVAATGTGKTVMAALDYRKLKSSLQRSRLLFVAHREEILRQSLTTFRAVLRDGNFGDLWTGQHSPSQQDHLFASVQKLNNVSLEDFDKDHFDILIVDEFHHAAAPTYTRLIDHFQPKVLLGLTATPERADGLPILHWFEGRAAAELRLWDALERRLLCPFQYFGIHDNTDLQSVEFKRGRYVVQQLENVYTADNARVSIILKELEKHLADPREMRGLGFCVSVGHAEFMAKQFRRAGYAAVAVTGQTGNEVRKESVAKLRKGELQIIFTVNVFNEGIDLPEVDTLLLLRPTESATIFLQQLGRGLRLHEGKDCLTVLDFIGQARKGFRFDVGLRALIGGTRKEAADQVEQGFPHLPSGCSIQLDRVAGQIVLDNLKRSLRSNRAFLRQELSSLGPEVSLGDFLDRADTELADLYKGSKPGWMALRADLQFEKGEGDRRLAKAIARLIHLDDVERLEFLQQFVGAETAPQSLPESAVERRRLAMLHFSLWDPKEASKGLLAKFQDLWDDPWAVRELRALLPVLRERIDHRTWNLRRFPNIPLSIHGHYSLSEILAAFDVLTADKPHRIREGVYHHTPTDCDLFFITIRKNEKDYSPSTLYRDYAISPTLFHWESQSTTKADSKAGLRYQRHTGGRTCAFLFVRETSKDSRGETAPYLFLGPAQYVSHVGERPMAITWKLEVEIAGRDYFGLRLVG